MNRKQKLLIDEFRAIVGRAHVLSEETSTKYYRSGFRSGSGCALAVVFPQTLVEQWKVIELCVENQCVIIMQAAKTGLTEGSAPSGDDYDRDVIIINITHIDRIHLIDGGKQVICMPGARLHRLEKVLKEVSRAPHSVIGSSSLGATVVGGIANNSGGALVKRGPAYTELAIYAQVDKEGKLHLVNHLGIEGLGSTPEEILKNLDEGNFSPQNVIFDQRMASDKEYQQRVREVNADTPARFNADERRLFEASGCAGKLGVFAVRVDSYPLPNTEQVFYLGTNDPAKLSKLRQVMLSEFTQLPEMAEYLHRDIFNLAEKYGKDTFLSINILGTDNLPKLFSLKARVENVLDRIPLANKNWPDKAMYYASFLFPSHLPQRMLDYRDRYEHHLILKMSDTGIAEATEYLKRCWLDDPDCGFFQCTPEEGTKAFLHRFAAAGAAIKYETIHGNEVEDIIALDIALRRNDENWVETLPEEVRKHLVKSLYYGHFMCHVFHQDYIFAKGTDTHRMKMLMLEHLTRRGAKYPAEHNVGHLYEAETKLREFYYQLDPTNTFNPGIGKMDRYRRHCLCCAEGH
ncbi:D-lactate dehydrogenase [Vibrio sagamiensis]|uniref:Quinone-dependent D-lactate dehydrogenase n=1 Tax=Vibrio sagamiensis NBRC 104589 TaxID=1219064 RepID=A0A511QCL1_9VIBR|nr:D-lactate dehydrogenase [Vibrio sagamiensis]GEM75035.1 D-lactate dehydrogenase [Vibrio sagamiensis NBRC 104589]